MFRIEPASEEVRCEPRLVGGLSAAVEPEPLSSAKPPLALPAEQPEAEVRLRRPLPGSPPPPGGEQPIVSEDKRRRFGPVGSIVLHLLPLLLLLHWPLRPPVEVKPIPVELVFQPPPLPKPPVKPQRKPETRPPPGRIASVETGDTRAKGRDTAKSDEPAVKREPATTMESPLEGPERTAFLPPPPPLPEPPKLDLPKPTDLKPIAPSKPLSKPALATRQPVRSIAARSHLLPRTAKYPGPAATRDEYLAYLAYLARQHIGLLTPTLIAGRRGETIVNVLVLDDGTVAMLTVGLSSGYPDIDQRIEQMIRAVGRFPPLPQWYQAPAMRLEFRLQFPEALQD